MKWVGYICMVVTLQIVVAIGWLYFSGRFPFEGLELALREIRAGSAEIAASETEVPSPPEIPSYEDLLQERLLKSPEISRRIEELEAVRRAMEQERIQLDSARKDLVQIKKKLEGEGGTALDKAIQDGENKLLELVSVMKPKQAKEVLLADPDPDRVLRLLRNMEPVPAEKIFREFKQPEDQRILNGWLDRLGQGDPEADRLRLLMEQAKSGVGS
jgi:hypothetical protein